MKDVIEILKLRWLIFRRAIIETSWKNRIKIPIFIILFLILAWKGVGSLISKLYIELDERVFIIVPWWIIVTVGVIILLEGLRSTIKILYNNPENDLLLSLPIQLKHLFLERWLERFFLNVFFMLFCVLALFQYSQFAPVPWTYALLSINVLLLIQQLQFICTMMYSRKVIFGLKNGIFLIISLGVITSAIIFLSFITPQFMSNNDIYKSCFLSIFLFLITFLLQQLFVSSLNREYKTIVGIQFKAVRSFHKLFFSKSLVSFDQNIMSLIIKDIILILRQFPVLQCIVSLIAILILSFIMIAQEGNNTAIIFSVFSVFIIFIWTLYVFEFDKKQIHQMWILKVNPLSSKQIWKSKVSFIVLLVGINCFFLLIPALIRGFDLSVASLSIGFVIIQGLLFSFLAISILFVTYPFFKVGEYMYVILFAIFYSIVLIFPFWLIIIIPIVFFNYRKGLSHIEQMEL